MKERSEKFNGENFANPFTLILCKNWLKEMIIIVQQISVHNQCVFWVQFGGFLALFLCSDRGPARPLEELLIIYQSFNWLQIDS